MVDIELDDKHVSGAVSKQIMEHDIQQSWNPLNETLIEEMQSRIKASAIRHENARSHYNRLHKCIMYPTIFFTTLNGIVGYQNSCVDDTRSHVTVLVTSSINIVSALLLAYVKFMRIAEKVEGHSRSSRQYEVLYRKLQRQLSRPKEERNHADDVIKDTGIDFDSLLLTSPIIPRSIVKKNPLTSVCPADEKTMSDATLLAKVKSLLFRTHAETHENV